MTLDLAIYMTTGRHRSRLCAEAMLNGIREVEGAGKKIDLLNETTYSGPVAPIAVFYGLHGRLFEAFNRYRQDPALTAVYIDLGYWKRRLPGERWSGYHKIAVNARHPTAYFQKIRHPEDRRLAAGVQIAPWRRQGEHIILAGMGEKAARVEGFRYEQWEREAIDRIRLVSGRPIIYRPKPSDGDARNIVGTTFGPSKSVPIEDVLRGAWAVVTHHSNAACDALVAGVPAFCDEGVARPLATNDLSKIEAPLYPDDREQWANDVAYTQWSVAEMYSGAAWRYLRSEELVRW